MNLPTDVMYTVVTPISKPFCRCPSCSSYQFPLESFYCGAENKLAYADKYFCKKCAACVEFVIDLDGVGALSYRIVTDVLEYPTFQPHYVHAISDNNENPVQVVIKMDMTAGTDDDGDEHGQYWINEHTCPTNWLRVDVIAQHGDLDPHGVFRFVKKISVHEANRIIEESHLSDEEKECWKRKSNEEWCWELLFPGLHINKQVLNEDGDPLADDYIDGMSDVVAEVEALPKPVRSTGVYMGFVPIKL